jgi:hypothetical protein
MLETYHSPDEFRWNLHAFFQAINSFAQIGQMESQNSPDFAKFREVLNELMSRPTWRRLNKLRDEIVHKEPLLANASVMIGMYRGTRLKLTFQIPIPAHVPSWMAIAKSRNEKIFVDAHRDAIGEQIGLERIWKLPQFDEEMAQVCIGMLSECDRVMHLAPGHEDAEDICQGMNCDSPRMMFEHELFPEIVSAWDGNAPSHIKALSDTTITLLPEKNAEILHVIPADTMITAWVSQEKIWNETYSSLLIYSINDIEILESTAGFYMKNAFDKPRPGELPTTREDRI